ncbi:SpdD protein [Streptomyces winkii]|uniref:SpdD protein n=1 Tax=Streptomyces winkii TaxID=3051178 RepID=UPI0028D83CB8|nr:SpdD protein [Streptomyces sp. DSM 40971]
MLFRPQLPPNASDSAYVAGSSPVIHGHHSATATPVRRSLPSVSTGTIGLVLLGGVVLTALLTAVAVSAISVAVAAVVLRSLLNSQHRR